MSISQAGDNNSFFNKTHSIESRMKIGEKTSITQKGELNSQFGTVWINKNLEVKKIKKNLLESYLNEGWKRGKR